MKYTYDRVVLKQERFSVWRNIFSYTKRIDDRYTKIQSKA